MKNEMLIDGTNISIHDISINIWSGYECFSDRVMAQAQTWIPYFSDVNIFTDFVPKKISSIIKMHAYPASVNIVELGNCAKHLWRPNGWERAQPRFVKSMHESFNINNTKKWYVFVDDDSYIARDALVDILSHLNHSEPIVVGKFYCAWPDIVFGKNHSMECLAFPQGGAGVAISHTIMKIIHPFLIECNNKFNDRHYAGSMRFAKCLADHLDHKVWKFGKGIQNYKSQFHSKNPVDEVEDGNCNKPPATFHKLSPNELYFTNNGIYSRWDVNNRQYYVSWNNYTCQKIIFPLDDRIDEIALKFGYALTLTTSNQVISKATSEIYLLHQDNFSISFAQNFSSYIRIVLHCNNSFPTPKYLKVEENEYINYHFALKCPEIHSIDSV